MPSIPVHLRRLYSIPSTALQSTALCNACDGFLLLFLPEHPSSTKTPHH